MGFTCLVATKNEQKRTARRSPISFVDATHSGRILRNLSLFFLRSEAWSDTGDTYHARVRHKRATCACMVQKPSTIFTKKNHFRGGGSGEGGGGGLEGCFQNIDKE